MLFWMGAPKSFEFEALHFGIEVTFQPLFWSSQTIYEGGVIYETRIP